MHVPGETIDLPETGPEAARARGGPFLAISNQHTAKHIYDLRRGNQCSDAFYAALPAFCDELLAEIEQRAWPVLDGYSRHVREVLQEAPRSRGEYAIELLTLGMALRNYEGAAEATPGWVVKLARGLWRARSRGARIKPFADWLRGGVARLFLAPNVGGTPAGAGSAVERLAALAEWMQATGEFEQEGMRLNNWRSYLADLHPQKATYWLRIAEEIFSGFARRADKELGAYTRGVEPFLERERTHRRWREDLLLRGKPETEYHLNMVAAEVMNRGLREEFEQTRERVVLVPTCMRGAKAGSCLARTEGVDIVCAECDPECAVNRLTQRMRNAGVRVYLVPHASGFSRWLDRWTAAANEPGVGITAVACMLNILSGGYEMRARGIPSQCVTLDYPGCKKHWTGEGIATAVNEARLVQIAASSLRT